MRARRLGLLVLGVGLVVLALGCAPAFAVTRHVLTGSFGAQGTGNGEFKEPTALAVNDSLVEPTAGDVYVLDTANQRVEWFALNSTTKAYEYAGQFNGAGTPPKSFSFFFHEPERSSQGIAVDNSGSPTDPSAGDVYVADTGHEVIDRFSATGEYRGQVIGTCLQPGSCTGKTIPFGQLYGVAVDPSGKLWAAHKEAEELALSEFDSTGAYIKTIHTETPPASSGLAVDANNVYANCCGSTSVEKFDSVTGNQVAKIHVLNYNGEGIRAFTIEPSNGDLLLDDNENTHSGIPSVVVVHGPGGEPYATPLEEFPAEPQLLSESFGIAANEVGVVFVSQRGAGNVEIFTPKIFPTVTTGSGSQVSETSEMLHGTVNPEGIAIKECFFEYGSGTSYGQSVPCEQTPTGSGAVAVSAVASGLEARKTYHFRLVASNENGPTLGEDNAFYTINKPTIEGESSSNVGSTIATVDARINPSGVLTGYSVEYGLSGLYGSSTPEVSLGAGGQAGAVQVQLTGLQPGAVYHFRVVAKNALGTSLGPDMTLDTTASVAASPLTLPDSRAYELVSPDSEFTVLTPNTGGKELPADAKAPGMIRASNDGNSVTYLGEPEAEGGNGKFGGGNQYLAVRGPQGWHASNISTPGSSNGSSAYTYFSSNLLLGLIGGPAEVSGGLSCQYLYARISGQETYRAISPKTPTQEECAPGEPVSPGVSADLAHVLFESNGALVPGAKKGEGGEGANPQGNLYDSVAGHIYMVNVLPDGQPEPTATASFGAPPYGLNGVKESHPNFGNVVSADGSRIFWSSVEEPSKFQYLPKALYVRENDTQPQSPVGPKGECTVSTDACTVQVDAGEPACVAEGKCTGGGGIFWTASGNGEKVFFTDCNKLTAGSTAVPTGGCVSSKDGYGPFFTGADLYEYDVDTGHLSDLTVDHNPGDPRGAEVQGVIGASGDGSYVYFVAGGVLAPGASPRTCQQTTLDSKEEEGEHREEDQGLLPAHHGCNLYILHDGVTTFIDALLAIDNKLQAITGGTRGDWRASLGERTAQVTPDGHAVVFTSTRALTGYDSMGLREVFAYDALNKQVSCASCNPSGIPTTGNQEEFAETNIGGYLPVTQESSFMERFISDDGNRVFFETEQSLVPQDTNGLRDVYEWERNGTGSCPTTTAGTSGQGCIYLLSGGESSDNAYLIDSDATGDNVFFVSRGRLVPQAHDETFAVYDARVNGGFPAPSLACTGTGCQGVPPAPPIFATPSSVTFNGVGNFPPPTPAVKPRSGPHKAGRCKHGYARKHGRCVKAKARKTKSSRSAKQGRKR